MSKTVRRFACAGALAVAAAAWACLGLSAEGPAKTPRRFGAVIGLRAEKIEEYKKLHAAIWPEVAKALRLGNIRNYSIYLRKLPDGEHYLFSYFEYVGPDFQADMAKMSINPEVKRWLTFTNPCQKPLANRTEGEWWSSMEEVFHQD